MSAHASPNIITDGLAFMYDTGSGKSYKGQPTANLINQMIGTTTISYPENVYISTATETNVADSSAPGGQYSRFTGNTDSSNNQLYSRFNTASIDVRNTTITYSVYLKGSGTCHLTIYADNSGYGTSSTITLTNEWTHYTYTRSVTNYTTNCWVAVRGILTTTDVYIAAQQAEIKSHATQFVNGTRSATEGLIDRTNNATIDLSNASFDSDAQMVFDGTDDRIIFPAGTFPTIGTNDFTIEAVCKNTKTSSYNHFFSVQDQYHFALKMQNTSTRGMYVYRTSGLSTYSTVDARLTSTTDYYHIVCKRAGDSIVIFVNGVNKGAKTGWDNISIDNNLYPSYIGWGAGSEYTGGDIPIFKLYNRALTDEEVLQNYNATKSRFGL